MGAQWKARHKEIAANEKGRIFGKLRIEVQIRSRLQHAWATAVETVSAFTGYALRSTRGEATWRRFFALMGSAMAIREERARVPNTPQPPKDLFTELRALADRLDVETTLMLLGEVTTEAPKVVVGASMYLVVLDLESKQVSVEGFTKDELPKATGQYLLAEKRVLSRPGQAVLVSVDSIAQLRRAYPNYYADTKEFLKAVEDARRQYP